MSRYRPPREKSSSYITDAGFRRLKHELQSLWGRRREVVTALSAAAAEGDRSENAEYIYRKKQLREIDSRIGYLQRRLPVLKVVPHPPTSRERVYFGATVKLLGEDESMTMVRIVGADEIDVGAGSISVDSPMAKALLGRGVDDEVEVTTPSGVRVFVVLAVHYVQ